MIPTRAARLERHGEPLVVEEVELSDPAPGEVVVEIAYAGVNPVDRYNALGRVAADGPLPRTLGGEGSGNRDGRAVVVGGYGLGSTRDGLWAERAVVPAGAVIEVPDGVDLARAATAVIAGRTAWRTAVDLGGLAAGDRVLVLGASGGVGSLIVSLAHHRGATVWGHTGDGAKTGWVRQRGADDVVVAADGEALLTGELREFSPTLVLDCLGAGFTGACVEAAAPAARIVLYGTSAGPRGEVPLQPFYRKGLRMLGFGGLIETPESARAGTERALAAMAAGELEVVIDEILPLAQAGEALQRLAERQVLGKLVLDTRT